MSEKFFAILLRLYPARFRTEYGDEARQLFLDRLREERGLTAKLRLWCDMLADLAWSLPREHHRNLHALAAAPPRSSAGSAMFLILEDSPPRPGSFVFGTVFALVALGVFVFLLNHGAARHFRTSGETMTSEIGSSAGTDRPTKGVVPVSAAELDAAERHRVIAGVIANVKRYYGHPEEEQAIAELLLSNEQSGDYATIDKGSVFAAVLSRQMRSVTHDGRLIVFFHGDGISTVGVGIKSKSASFHRIDQRFGIQIF